MCDILPQAWGQLDTSLVDEDLMGPGLIHAARKDAQAIVGCVEKGPSQKRGRELAGYKLYEQWRLLLLLHLSKTTYTIHEENKTLDCFARLAAQPPRPRIPNAWEQSFSCPQAIRLGLSGDPDDGYMCGRMTSGDLQTPSGRVSYVSSCRTQTPGSTYFPFRLRTSSGTSP